MRKRDWMITGTLFILCLVGFRHAMHGPATYIPLQADQLPAQVQSKLKTSERHPSFRTCQYGKDVYILFDSNQPGAYTKITMKAHKRFSRPEVIAMLNHATNNTEATETAALKLPNSTDRDVRLVVRDKR
ncbi:hypothetical protein NCCP2716_11090 [Sporosarcina sp. NCCP-2716]|uniref:hypothetical protein n=1 Tax=Sporosarcina sp. NCCP-2716 TaxID=2943679 RepID=UPI00203CC952|nr:hypothetical protein [Sporosarcina sp. NCCP-2716]GKV68611.1 hypothetical protein NCCP2716_11090 [Sporosarcina sp. NCCP-2716]